MAKLTAFSPCCKTSHNVEAASGMCHILKSSKLKTHRNASLYDRYVMMSKHACGLDTDCSVKRLLDLMSGLAVLFYFPLFLCQKELKFGVGVSSLVA